MTIDELQNKPAILEGLADWLNSTLAYDYARDPIMAPNLMRWIDDVRAIQSAITQVGEEE